MGRPRRDQGSRGRGGRGGGQGRPVRGFTTTATCKPKVELIDARKSISRRGRPPGRSSRGRGQVPRTGGQASGNNCETETTDLAIVVRLPEPDEPAPKMAMVKRRGRPPGRSSRGHGRGQGRSKATATTSTTASVRQKLIVEAAGSIIDVNLPSNAVTVTVVDEQVFLESEVNLAMGGVASGSAAAANKQGKKRQNKKQGGRISSSKKPRIRKHSGSGSGQEAKTVFQTETEAEAETEAEKEGNSTIIEDKVENETDSNNFESKTETDSETETESDFDTEESIKKTLSDFLKSKEDVANFSLNIRTTLDELTLFEVEQKRKEEEFHRNFNATMKANNSNNENDSGHNDNGTINEVTITDSEAELLKQTRDRYVRKSTLTGSGSRKSAVQGKWEEWKKIVEEIDLSM